MPATIESGDLLLMVGSMDGTTVTVSGWDTFTSVQTDTGSGVNTFIGYKSADGTEDSGTITLTISASEKVVARVWAIQDWDGTTAPEVSTVASGFSTSADPSSVTPAGGSDDYLYIATATVNYGNALTTPTYPSGYTSTGQAHSGGASGIDSLMYGIKGTTGSTTDDPSAFGWATTSYTWQAHTIAVTPAAAGSTTTWTDTTIDVGQDAAGTLDVAFSGNTTQCEFASGDTISVTANASTTAGDCSTSKANFLSGGSLSNTRIASATTAFLRNATETSTGGSITINSPDNGTTEHFGTAGNASPDPDSLYSDSDFTTEYSSFDSNSDDVWVTVSTGACDFEPVEGIFDCTVVPATGVVRVYDVSATDWLTESSWTVTSPQGDCQTDVVLSPLVRPIVYSPITQIFCN